MLLLVLGLLGGSVVAIGVVIFSLPVMNGR